MNPNNDPQTSPTTTSSSSSSVYSSPHNTPTTVPGSNVGGKDNNNGTAVTSPQKNPKTTTSTTQRYEELMKHTKTKMNNTFEQLQKETGLVLEHFQQDPNNKIQQPDSTLSKKHGSNTECSINNKNGESERNEPLKESQYLFLEKEISRLKGELSLKNDIIGKMCKIRSQVESELEDLTASLFEEANKMVYSANVLRDRAEKELHEANLKIDMLTAEVQALKLLVITSTPSRPNAHLHPQLAHHHSPSSSSSHNIRNNSPCRNNSNKQNSKSHLRPKSSLPMKSPSNYELGEHHESIDSNIDSQNANRIDKEDEHGDDECGIMMITQQPSSSSSIIGELDPVFYEEFQEWRKCPTFEPINSNFMKRIYDEEIYPVFNFKNKHLTSLVLRSIENNTLTVESIHSDKLPFPKKCALLEVPRLCRYRMKIIDDDGQWHYISQLCRNRITTVCDLFCYLRYVQDGLVKSNNKDMFWHIMKRRRNIALSKLGFFPSNMIS